ncbi:MAG: porin family protein [Xanthobacteraceae bacterium]|nr:porin family protein [Xanthobacteraceae bacterium]
MRKILLSTVTFGLLAVPAMAADLPPAPAPYYPAPVAIPVFTWTGCYIGGTGGWAWSNTNDRWGANPAGFLFPGPLAVSSSFHSSGGTGGVEGGCNYQVNPWFVFGVEGDWEATGLSSSFGGTVITPAGSYPFTQSFSSHWLSTVRARAGYAAGPWLFYATGGAAFANLKRSDTLTLPSGNTVNGLQSTTASGWTIGAGVEWALAFNWIVRAEYLYVDLPATTYTAVNNGVPLSFITATHSDLHENIIRAAVSYKFF